ncbi:hypothetical protein GLYMA_02G304051v4 [Glycine max]|uniref:Galacturonosyltransferase 8 n=1 Tax=Glycine soja TaxID=3848 RepID=A0A0B2SHX3_GLYSO|nr:hypothetical protein GLYMA_02G304051v4 [Glycine max]KAG5064816.1 hypothetical protein JHK85_005999 [Glycine max]KAG5081782.1 hypothetical protein JHK86_005847 [Glycine max]KAH1062886.1 hypothetical protein GYH30_005701 [Glycine max]KHN43932.1 Galacturonosyltransferase 8 [Glycine soja]
MVNPRFPRSRIFASAIFISFCIFFATHSYSPHHTDSNGGVESIRRSIIALKTDPLKPRLEQIRKQADDHGSLARVCFLCTQAQAGELKACKDFRGAMWQLGGSYEQTSIQASFQQSVLRQVVGDAKESFDNQLKTQKLKDTIFAVNEQLTKAKKQGANSKELALSLHEVDGREDCPS